MSDWIRETPAKRSERQRDARHLRQVQALKKLVADLSDALTDKGPDWSQDGLDNLRKRVANVLPPAECPAWLLPYRDSAVCPHSMKATLPDGRVYCCDCGKVFVRIPK
jgi:hypothetical protein